jgi:hypothetical protein
MAFCLTLPEKQKFKQALRSGELNIAELAKMVSSEERRNALAKYVGKENAVQVNALLESKFLLKDIVAGAKRWIKKVSVEGSPLQKDLITRLAEMKVFQGEQFYQDLATIKLRMQPTEEQAKTVTDLAKDIVNLKAKADKDGVFANKSEQVTYGLTKVALEKYLGDMKMEAKRIFFREQPVKKVLSLISELPGTFKSAVASMDNSFWGRQGIKTFWDPRLTHIWLKNFLKSWVNIGKQIFAKGKWYKSGDDAVMDLIKANIYSRPNGVNGKYEAGKYGLSVLSEEAYPSSSLEKIPLLGRLFKASEVAYNGGALTLRADLADRLIKIAEKQGVDTLDPEQAVGMGHLISSQTGRGDIGRAEMMGKEINTIFFSIKFLKSNFDTLTAHILDPKVRANPVARKEAAMNILSIIATLGSVLTVAKLLNKDSVEEDPRSTNFGKIKVFGHWTDMTGGMASLVTLASWLIPTFHNGQLGFWSKNSAGVYRNLISGEFGMQTGMDVINSFWQGKLSPIAGIFRDMWQGKDYSGKPFTATSALWNSTTPISIQNLQQLLNDPASSFVLGSMILDALGFSTMTQPATNSKTQLIPTDKVLKNTDFLSMVNVYMKAFSIDRDTAWNRIFTGQRIVQISPGNIIVVARDDNWDERKKEYAKKYHVSAEAIKEVREEHLVPIKGGGADVDNNRVMVSKSLWTEFTKVDNAYISARKTGKISQKEGDKLIIEYKLSRMSGSTKITQEQILEKLK